MTWDPYLQANHAEAPEAFRIWWDTTSEHATTYRMARLAFDAGMQADGAEIEALRAELDTTTQHASDLGADLAALRATCARQAEALKAGFAAMSMLPCLPSTDRAQLKASKAAIETLADPSTTAALAWVEKREREAVRKALEAIEEAFNRRYYGAEIATPYSDAMLEARHLVTAALAAPGGEEGAGEEQATTVIAPQSP